MKKIVSLIMVLCILVHFFPLSTIDVNAVMKMLHTEVGTLSSTTSMGIELSGLSCEKFLSNETHRAYIEMMLRYYINANSDIQNALLDGQSAIFMFEGGADYYNPEKDEDSNYDDALRDIRRQAVVIVVQVKDNAAFIKFYSENCSSIPGDPKFSIQVDGIYQVKTWNHQQTYGALQIIQTGKQCIKAPDSNKDGYWHKGEGINIHTRSSQYAGGTYDDGTKWYWSEGCQLIGSGTDTDNIFNKFMKYVTGIDYNVWVKYTESSKKYNKITAEKIVGYYIIDRQLALDGLTELYNDVALEKITKASTAAHKAALAAQNPSYLNKCTTYPAYCTIKASAGTAAMTLPCSTGTNADSAVVESVSKGATYTATALILNDQGNHWYQVETADGKTAYLPAGKMDFAEALTSDLTISGATAPTELAEGNTFAIAGKIKSIYNEISKVSAYVYSGTDTSGASLTGGSATVNGKSYSLKGSDVDSKVKFGTLSPGTYTYAVYAYYKNYYADTEKTSATNTGKVCLYTATFTVTGKTSSCAHSYDGKVTTSPTCIADGTKTYTCSKCGASYTEAIAATGHSYGEWVEVKAPTTTETGLAERVCANCGDTEQKVLDKLDTPVDPNGPQVVIESKTAIGGQTITVQIIAANMPNVKSLMIENYQYDSNLLEFVSAEMHFDNAFIADWDSENRIATVAFTENTDINGVIMTLTFRVKDGVEGESTISCDLYANKQETGGSESQVSVTIISGAVTVMSYPRGDVNGDGYVNSDDAIYLLRYTLSPSRYPINQDGDMNGDGYVNSDDAIYLLRHTLSPERYPLS